MEKFISSFDEACAKLGRGIELPDVSKWPERLQGHLTALYKLDTILEVNNRDWKADIADTGQWKYYPWFEVNPDKEKPAGFGLSYLAYGYDRSNSDLGARLACKSSDMANFMGENCTELYEQLHA